MQGFRLITLSFLMIFVGCSRAPDTGILNERLSPNSASIFEGFYLNSPSPYKLSRSRVNGNYDYVKANYPLIFQKVSRAFPENKLVVAYLLLDSDRDGKLDWVFDEQSNSLVSFDEDIDGDGVDNYLDLDPFDTSVGFQDKNENELPDHLESEDPKILETQVEFLNKYQVYVINQSSYHTLKSLVAFQEVVEFGFNHHSFKGFKYLAAFSGNSIPKVLAFQRGHSKLIGVTNLGRKQSENKVFRSKISMSFYGTVFHELVHAEEYSILRNDRESDDFLTGYLNELFLKNGKEWKYIGKQKLVSHYSTSGPREYLAELGAAFFYKEVVNRRYRNLKGVQKELLIKRAMRKIILETHINPLNLDEKMELFFRKKFQIEAHGEISEGLFNRWELN